MAKLFESDDYFLISFLSLFLLINFNQQIGLIYGMMTLIDWMAYYVALDKGAFKIIPIEKDKRNRFLNLAWAMGAYVAFVFAVNFLTMQFQGTMATSSAFENVSQLIAQTFSQTPILATSAILTLLVWGVFIPRIETLLFFRTALQYGFRSANFKFLQSTKSVFSTQALLAALFFGAIFAIFHLVAKSITNNLALLVTFLFGFYSVMLVIHFRDVVVAVFLHVITNTIATMQQLRIGFFATGSAGITSSGIMILAGVLMVTWFLMFQEIPLINLFTNRRRA